MQTDITSSKTDKNFPSVGWVFFEKIGFYKYFRFKRWHLFTLKKLGGRWQYLFLTFLQNRETRERSPRRGAITDEIGLYSEMLWKKNYSTISYGFTYFSSGMKSMHTFELKFEIYTRKREKNTFRQKISRLVRRLSKMAQFYITMRQLWCFFF